MLLVYKLKYLPKVQIFHLYIIDAFKLFLAFSHPIIVRFSNFEVDFVASFTNVVSELFPWLVVMRSRKTCLARSASECSTAFFIKVRLLSKLYIEIPQKCLSRKLLTLIIIIIITVNAHLFTVAKKMIQIV